VTIEGSNFQSGATVTFGTDPCTGLIVVDAETITCTTPAHAAGLVDVTVTNPDTQSDVLTDGFTYVESEAPPTIDSVTPTSGLTAGGTEVTIEGSNFQSGATVTFGTDPCTGLIVVDAETITCTTPAHAAGLVDVTVTNPDTQSDVLEDGFTYVAPAPTISGISPSGGPSTGGTEVTITGTGFQSGAEVTFAGNQCTGLTVVNATTITCTTPSMPAGTVDVTVTNPDGQSATLAAAFNAFQAEAIPTASELALLLLGLALAFSAVVMLREG
ncbi:MAG TPA: IPT/TIG domain-containing protein, partial [Thermoanaerobaculia bacterium]